MSTAQAQVPGLSPSKTAGSFKLMGPAIEPEIRGLETTPKSESFDCGAAARPQVLSRTRARARARARERVLLGNNVHDGGVSPQGHFRTSPIQPPIPVPFSRQSRSCPSRNHWHSPITVPLSRQALGLRPHKASCDRVFVFLCFM